MAQWSAHGHEPAQSHRHVPEPGLGRDGGRVGREERYRDLHLERELVPRAEDELGVEQDAEGVGPVLERLVAVQLDEDLAPREGDRVHALQDLQGFLDPLLPGHVREDVHQRGRRHGPPRTGDGAVPGQARLVPFQAGEERSSQGRNTLAQPLRVRPARRANRLDLLAGLGDPVHLRLARARDVPVAAGEALQHAASAHRDFRAELGHVGPARTPEFLDECLRPPCIDVALLAAGAGQLRLVLPQAGKDAVAARLDVRAEPLHVGGAGILHGLVGTGRRGSSREGGCDGGCQQGSEHLAGAYSLALLFRCAASSFFTSSGESFGRSMVSVILPILPVKANGTW